MPRPSSKSLLRDAVILFFGVLCATWIITPIQVESTVTLILVALVLSLFNVFLKPLLVFFTLPLVIFTFGLSILLINAVLLFLAGQLIPGFTVPGFGVAFLGSLIISFISLMVNVFLSPRQNVRIQWVNGNVRSSKRVRRTISKRDVIDV